MTLIKEGDLLESILLVRSGTLDCRVRTSLHEEMTVQTLFSGCSYGTNTYHINEDSEDRMSRFKIIVTKRGELLQLKYDALKNLVRANPELK